MTAGPVDCAGRLAYSDKEHLDSGIEIKNEDITATPKTKSKGGTKGKVPEESRVVKDFRGEERVINQRHRLRRVEI